MVIFALDKEMNHIAVGVNAAHDQLAVIVLQRRWLQKTLAAALGRFVPGRSRVLHFQRDRLYAVAVFGNVIGNRIICPQRGGKNEGELVLSNDVARSIFRSRFRSRIGEALKTERCLVKMRRLLGIADIELDVIGALERKKISFGGRSCFRSGNCRWHRRSFRSLTRV